MKNLFLLISFMLFSQSVFACDATLIPRKDYIVITSEPVKNLSFQDEHILSGQKLFSIFSEKNQIILKPKNIGKTKLVINDKEYLIEVSKEQKEEWNIEDFSCLEIDIPPKDEVKQ